MEGSASSAYSSAAPSASLCNMQVAPAIIEQVITRNRLNEFFIVLFLRFRFLLLCFTLGTLPFFRLFLKIIIPHTFVHKRKSFLSLWERSVWWSFGLYYTPALSGTRKVYIFLILKKWNTPARCLFCGVFLVSNNQRSYDVSFCKSLILALLVSE